MGKITFFYLSLRTFLSSRSFSSVLDKSVSVAGFAEVVNRTQKRAIQEREERLQQQQQQQQQQGRHEKRTGGEILFAKGPSRYSREIA